MVIAVTAIGVGQALIRPATRLVGSAPGDLHAQTVVFPSSTHETVSAWFAHGTAGNGVVLLLHGVRADRRSMQQRARALQAAGFGVMLMDLPAHGESTGAHITFGLREAEGVRAALAYLREMVPQENVGVVAVSLGAASFVLANAAPQPHAVVLESMYPTITQAVEDRLAIRLGSLGRFLAPALLWQIPLRLGISPEQLRPIQAMQQLDAPVMVAAGTLDRHTTRDETLHIFDAAHQPKELWLVEGAAHVDLQAYDPQACAARVLPFLIQYLHKAR
jgi:alpha-beta hydrolase superfamily lysophospholipase